MSPPSDTEAVRRENTATIRRWYEALNREDFDAALALVDSEVELFPPGGQPPYRGAEQLRRWMEPDAFPKQEIVLVESVAVTERLILARQHVTARGASSGLELDLVSLSVWRFDERGLVTRIAIYLESEAERALGSG